MNDRPAGESQDPEVASDAPASGPPPDPPQGAPASEVPPPLALDDRERTLDAGVVALWRLQAAARWGVLLVAGGPLGALAVPAARWLPTLVVSLLAVVTIAIVPPWQFRRWRWRVASDALELRHGIVVHRQIAVPYFRIQQIDVTRRPLERLAGLAALEVTTASASGTVRLPGLAASLAPALRTTLIERARDAMAAFEGDSRDAV